MRGIGYVAVATAATCVLLYGCDREVVTPVPTAPTLHPSSTPRKATLPAAQGGQWSAVFAWPIVGAHMSVLPDGRLLTWTSNDMDHTDNTPYVFLWSPANPSVFTQVPNAATDVFCSSHTFLSDGRLFVAGGHVADNTGSKDGNIFDFQTSSWSQLPQMRAGRWYPSTVTLGDGEIGVAAGGDENQNPNPIPEVWDGSKFRVLSGAPLVMPIYPWLHLAPDGRVFNAGPEKQTRYLNPSGDGQWVNAGQHINSTFRDYGTAVVYAPGKLIALGGGDPPVNTAELVDLNVGTTWTSTSSMQFARRQLNALVLADGKVLVVGGTNAAGFNTESGSILTPELWNPATGSWATMSDMTIPRTYHSTAVLMPDARVLSAGGGRCGSCQVNHLDAQIFSPPYLFNADGSAATRPTITSAPTTLNRGQSFTVSTPDAARIARATLARLPSTSHAFNMNQAFVSLPVTQTSGGVQLIAPASPNLVPAGHYMLFLLDGNGVPSVAKIVQLLGTAALPAPPAAPSAPASLSASTASTAQINLKWTDNSTSESSFRIERCQGTGCAGFAEIAFVGANVSSYANTGLTTGATYSYRVRAMNAAGGSGYTNVATATVAAVTLSTLKNRAAARCMEVPGSSTTNFTQLTIQDCNGASNQLWSTLPVGTSGEIRVYGTKCIDGNGAENGGTNGQKISIYDCHGGTNQQWTRSAAGEIRNFTGLMCIEVSGKATANASPLVLWTCDGSNSQKWDTPSSTPTNQPPTANFTSSCNALSCTFTNTSTDADGTIASSSWTFGDGSGSTATSTSHTYDGNGSYPVSLTVTDNKSASTSITKSVTVAASPSPISLQANGSRAKGVHKVALSWTGATTSTVDLYRDGAVIARPPNNTTTKSGSYTDNLNRKGSATYKYKVCAANSTTVCSAVVTVVF
jgi:PKD repeat protein